MELTGRTSQELSEMAVEFGQPSFRGNQIGEWLYKKTVRAIDDMINLPASLRAEMALKCQHPLLKISTVDRSIDGTAKYLLDLADGNRVECVYLPYADRKSICISTQVGCAMDCSFCATGIGGLTRDLTAGEIVDQVLLTQAEEKQRITHVVYMGMGEPLANYDQTVKSIRLLLNEVGISARHITVSTVGLAPAIRRLANEGIPLNLAVSIHASADNVRSTIMPIASVHSMADLLDACRYWIETTKRKITFEYLLLAGVNDGPSDAVELGRRIKPLLASVNIIPYNHVEGRGDYRRPDRHRINTFKEALTAAGVTVTERKRKGNPINAACGQLRHESEIGRKITSP
ncbi:MAG: 23S rRNA (adenine(2503)-C(2))-methyltransferase RlmN [Armatimonadota bacterium]